jgi:hypothetical protein
MDTGATSEHVLAHGGVGTVCTGYLCADTCVYAGWLERAVAVKRLLSSIVACSTGPVERLYDCIKLAKCHSALWPSVVVLSDPCYAVGFKIL